jgi:hypothetical protein
LENEKYHFELRADIAHDVAMQQVTTFGEMVQKSYHAEASLNDSRKERVEVMQKKKYSGKYNLQLKTKGFSSKESRVIQLSPLAIALNVDSLTLEIVLREKVCAIIASGPDT